MSSQNLELIKGLYAAFAKGDVPGVLGALDPNIEWTEAEGFPLGGTYHGPQAVLENVFMRLGTEWEGWAAVPHSYVDGGDTIVSMGKYSGKYNATGKSFTADFAHVWTLKDGKAVRFYQYVDSHIVRQAM